VAAGPDSLIGRAVAADFTIAADELAIASAGLITL
jgi:hypothetical protein